MPVALTPTEQAAVANLRADPVLFNRLVLKRPEPTEHQKRIMRSVMRHRATHVRSGNMVGKDWTAAGVALHFLFTNPHSVVITTGPSNTQIETVLWGEMRKSWRRARLFGDLKAAPQRLILDDDWYALGFSTKEAERLSGFHARVVLVIVDEASGVVDAEIWEAIDGLVNGPDDRLLTIGNPLRPEGRFYEYFSRPRPGHNLIQISSLESPNMGGLTAEQIRDGADHPDDVPGLASTTWVRDMANGYGIGSNWWLAHVLGEFPQATDDQTFPLFWLEQSREIEGEYAEQVKGNESLAQRLTTTRRMGVDVGEGRGGDESVIIVRDRLRVLHRWEDRHTTPMALAAKVLSVAEAWDVNDDEIVIDAIGPGNGTIEALAERQFYVEAFRGGAQAKDKLRFFNRRAEGYWHLREAVNPDLESERFSIGDDPRLLAQLQATKHKEKSDRVIALEAKEKIAARLEGDSPDRADALSMTFAPSMTAKFETVRV